MNGTSTVTSGTSGSSSPAASSSTWLSDLGQIEGLGGYFGEVAAGGHPTASQDVHAATSAAKLGADIAGRYGGLSSSTVNAVGTGAADIANIAAIVKGFQRGGVQGYGTAAINTAQLGARTAGQMAAAGEFGSASGEVAGVAQTVGQIAGPLASALAIYNFSQNWRSGKTGSDAIQGAETGATVGATVGSFFPVIGTAVGALAGLVIGGAAGALSSAFGPGAKDPEQANWVNYFSAYKQYGAQGLGTITAPQAFQTLAGVFDARSSDTPMYATFGRMGEGAFTSAMAGQINSAIQSGRISASATPQQMMDQVVNPWIEQMHNPASKTGKGWAGQGYQGDVPALKNLITSLIGQYQTGQLTSKTSVGISGQEIGNLPAYAGHGPPTAQQQQMAAAQTKVNSWLNPMLTNFPLARH